MTGMSNDKRESKGQPAGGQFAAHNRAEGDVSLAAEPAGQRIIAKVQRQNFNGYESVDYGAPLEVDVTDIVNSLTPDQRDDLATGRVHGDGLYIEAVQQGLVQWHVGPFTVDYLDSMTEYNSRVEDELSLV